MSNIVERLRREGRWDYDPRLFREAADEIERLRKVCKDQAGVELSEENDRLIDEIERLQAELKQARASLKIYYERYRDTRQCTGR